MPRPDPTTQYTPSVPITRGDKSGTTRHSWHAIAEIIPDGRPWDTVHATGEGKRPHVAVQRAVVDAFGRLS